jgi:putative addiction module killer protein
VTRITREKQIIIYADENGAEPLSNWIKSLRDTISRKRIFTRIDRLAQGNYGDCRAVGEGVSELQMFFGSGYRVYFAEKNDDLIILLCGGDKSSQAQDIKEAKAYWKEYLKNEKI